MPTAAELLQQISDKLSALTDRLTDVGRPGVENGPLDRARRESVGTNRKPSLLDAGAKLLDSMESPKLSGLSKVVRQGQAVGDAFEGIRKVWRGTPEAKASDATPTVAKPRQTMLGGSALPSVMNKTMLAPGSGPAMPGATASLEPILKDMLAALKSIDGKQAQQTEGGTADDAERLGKSERQPAIREESEVATFFGHRSSLGQRMPMRHSGTRKPQSMPSAKGAEAGEMGEAAEGAEAAEGLEALAIL